MKLTVINAVVRSNKDNTEFSKYLHKVLLPNTEIIFEQVNYGFPSIECNFHGMVNGAEVVRLAQKAENEGSDGVFVNCFDDPGVYEARELIRIPVYGAYQPAILTAMGLADRIGIITTDKAGILSESRKAFLNGFEKRIFAVHDVDLKVLSLENNLDLLAERLAKTCIEMYEKEQIGALTLGCTGMYKVIGLLRKKLAEARCAVSVIEPLQNGVSYLEHIVKAGYSNALGVIDNVDLWKSR
jgi:allantoin racemase